MKALNVSDCIVVTNYTISASKMTYIVSGGALNPTHLLTYFLVVFSFYKHSVAFCLSFVIASSVKIYYKLQHCLYEM